MNKVVESVRKKITASYPDEAGIISRDILHMMPFLPDKQKLLKGNVHIQKPAPDVEILHSPIDVPVNRAAQGSCIVPGLEKRIIGRCVPAAVLQESRLFRN